MCHDLVAPPGPADESTAREGARPSAHDLVLAMRGDDTAHGEPTMEPCMPREHRPTLLAGIGLALGTSLGCTVGVVVGAASGELGLWIALGVPFGGAIGLTAGIGLATLLAERPPEGTCPHCGYATRGLAGTTCPECGGDVTVPPRRPLDEFAGEVLDDDASER